MTTDLTLEERRALKALERKEQAKPWEWGKVPDVADMPLTTLDLTQLSTTRATPKAFAIEQIAPLAEVTLFTGPGSAGKSLLAQQFATAAASAQSCLGLSVMPGPAIYLTCEDDADQLHWRQQHLCEAANVPMAELAGRLHLSSLRGALDNHLATFAHDGTLKPEPAYHRIEGMIQATGTKLVFLDNVAHLFTGNENDRGQVTRFVNLLNGVAGNTGAAIVLIAHPNKSGDSYSGSTAWLNAVRSQCTLDLQRDSDGTIDDPDARTLSTGKANYSRLGEAVKFRWHKWAFVRDEDLPSETRAALTDAIKINGENAAFLKCLVITTEQKRAVSHNPGSNFAPKVFAAMTEGKNYKEHSYKSAMERLLSLGRIQLDQPLWRGPNRVMKQGIKLAEICTDPPAPTPCTDLHETRTNAARFNPPLSYGYTGQADGPPDPDLDSDDWSKK